MAGSITRASVSLPQCCCAYASPATDPGTAIALYPSVLMSVITLPSLSRYMSAVAFDGAFSR